MWWGYWFLHCYQELVSTESLSVRGGGAVGVSHISHVRVIVQLQVDRENCTDI